MSIAAPATPVLALHGFTGTGADFDPVAGSGWQSPDVIGHGAAPAPRTIEPYTMAAEVARVDGVLPDEALLVGYSMGGRLALSLAVQRAAQGRPAAGLILIGASPGIDDPAARAERRQADASLADRIEAIGVDAFLAEWSSTPIINSQRRIEPAIRAAMAARRRMHRARGLANSLRGMGTGAMPPLWRRLPELRCPTLLIVGAEDEKFGAIASRMARRLPDAEVVQLEGAGHCAHLERPSAFRHVVQRWRAGRSV